MTPPRFLVAMRETLRAIDADVRAAVPKCPECDRPDGGIVPNGFTPLEVGIVDRKRCPSATCPMKRGQA